MPLRYIEIEKFKIEEHFELFNHRNFNNSGIILIIDFEHWSPLAVFVIFLTEIVNQPSPFKNEILT